MCALVALAIVIVSPAKTTSGTRSLPTQPAIWLTTKAFFTFLWSVFRLANTHWKCWQPLILTIGTRKPYVASPSPFYPHGGRRRSPTSYIFCLQHLLLPPSSFFIVADFNANTEKRCCYFASRILWSK